MLCIIIPDIKTTFEFHSNWSLPDICKDYENNLSQTQSIPILGPRQSDHSDK